jgi:hypothetical protein
MQFQAFRFPSYHALLSLMMLVDTTAPVISDCRNFTLTADPGQQTATLSREQRMFTVVDDQDCDATINLPSQQYAIGTTQYALDAFDSSNNMHMDACVGYITVTGSLSGSSTEEPSSSIPLDPTSIGGVDRIPPVLVCPMHSRQARSIFSIIIDENGTGSFECVINNSFTIWCESASVTDNVGVTRLEQSPPPTAAFTTPSTIVITAWDAENNNASCNFTVLVNDNTPPLVTCPADTIVPEDPASLMRNVVILVRAKDNVSLRSVSIRKVSSQALVERLLLPPDFGSAMFSRNSTVAVEAGSSETFELSATDGNAVTGNGLTSSCTFNVTVQRSQLTSSLLSLASTPVSEVDANFVKNITESAENLTALQASIVIDVVAQLVAVVNTSTAPAIFSALDNLNTLPVETIQAAQSSTGGATRIREAILDFATAISGTQEGTVVLEGESLKIVTTAANASNLPTFSFNENSTQPGAEPVFAATLEPSSLEVEPNATRVVALFSLFRDDRLFPSSETTVLSSPVVDITILGARLNGTLDFSVKPDVLMPSNPFRCVFWSEDTSRWNDSGLTTIINAETVDCSSVHLTNFAVLVVSCVCV